MPTVTRKQFQDAINEGLAFCPQATAEQLAALRKVGAEASEFGNNFDTVPGCPMALAGLYVPGDVLDTRVESFYVRFDQKMGALLGFAAYITAEKIEVR